MAKHRAKFVQDTIALVYDFDGTLSPQPMQEYTILPEIDIDPKDFWEEVGKESREQAEEHMLTYMRLLVEKTEKRDKHVGRSEFRRMGERVKYFVGVETWFDRINSFVHENSGGRIRVHHYIISAGLKEILEGVSIKKHFHNIFASEYHYGVHKQPTFPKLLITDTTKTQYLFRINKGKEQLSESINSHMPHDLRPIPFENIIYIGDGETDVPSMTVTRQEGGNAIAVYPEGRAQRQKKSLGVCKTLLDAERVNFIAPANYSEGSILERRVHLLLRSVMARIEYKRELFECRRQFET